MDAKVTKKLGLALLVTLMVLAACRKEEEALPTAIPTAAVPEALPTAAGAHTATPAPQPTATPRPVAAVKPEDIDWPPQVIYTSPAPGEEVLLNGAFTIRFDQPMNQASVESAFEVQASSGGPAVKGAFSWPREDTLIFTPDSTLKRRQSYRVHLGETAAGKNGFTLGQPLELFLQTVGYLEASQVIPADEVSDVETDAAITVLFNRPVVPLISTGQQAGLPQPLTIDPPVSGRGEWVSTSIYRFVPDEPLAGATTYRVSIAPGLQDVADGVLKDAVTWSFSTLPPRVTSTIPADGKLDVIPTRPITITFNMPMDRAATEAAISLRSPVAPAVPFDYQWSENDTVVTLRPQRPLRLQSGYQLLIDQSARSAGGEATLERQVVSAFETVPFPAVVETIPGNKELADRWQRGIFIRFASPMDWSTVDGRLRIDPDPGDVTYFFYEDSPNLQLDFEFTPNTEYVVTIPGDVADPYGNILGKAYTWRFTSRSSDPLVSFNLPERISQLSTSFPSRVDVMHRNVSSMDVAMYELGLPLNLINDPYTAREYRPAVNPLRTWSIEVNTPREQVGAYSLDLADGGTLPTGVYFLAIESPEVDPDINFWPNQKHILIVADTNIVVKEMFDQIYAWVTDIATGQPAPGRALTLYNQYGAAYGTAVSDENGFARFDAPPADYLSGVTVVSNQPGESGFGVGRSSWNEGVDSWQFGLDTRGNDEPPVFAYIYTDRPIYRPGDTIHYKGIVRDANYGRYALPTQGQVTVRLMQANYFIEEGLDDIFTVPLDEMGAFSGEYTLPDDVALGSYQFLLEAPNIRAERTFTIAEYRKPEFLLTLTPAKEQTLRGEPVEVTLEASYFFGGPASDLMVDWSIYQESYRPDVPGPYYAFGNEGALFYTDFGPFGPGFTSSFGEYLIGGTGRTDGDGRLTIRLPADLLDEVEAGSRRVTVEATVSDLADFPISGRTSVIFHAAETYVGIIPAEFIAKAGAPAGVNLLTVDWDGQAVSGQDVEVVFYQREWKRTRDAEFGIYVTRWEPVDTEVDRVRVTTNDLGKASAEFVPPVGGTYVAVATVTDRGGREHSSSTSLWATDARYIAWRTDRRERRMDLVLDQQEYHPGDTARLLVQSPFAGPVKAWLTIERGTLLEQRLITLQSTSDVIEIPISPDFAPNVFVSVTAVKGVTPNDPDDPYADIRLGITELVVSPEQLALNLTLTPQSDTLAPGETAVFEIQATDFAGRPMQAELSLALVDLAVLTLKEDNAPPILEAFYARQPYRSRVGAGLFISGEGLELEVPVEAPGFGGGGGPGFAEAALEKAAGGDEEETVRRDFPDTAFWRAKITTDGNGRATVEIPLPDSLTTWRLSSKAFTADTLVGQTNVDVVVTKPLLVRPVTPRFFTAGDVIQLGAIVNNNTDQAIEAAVSLEAEGLALHAAAEQRVSVPAHGRQLVRWQALVEDAEAADLVFHVEGGGYRDATRPTFGEGPDNLIPIVRYDAQDLVGTSGVLEEAGRRVEAVLLPPGVDTRQGSVDITLSPSLAAAITEALNATNDSEYLRRCAHLLTDHLLPNVATARALRTLAIDDAALLKELNDLIADEVQQLQSLVKADGGWGWCYSADSNPWLTAYALLGLIKAREAGYGSLVNSTIINHAGGYLANQLKDPARLENVYEVNRQAFFLYVLAEHGVDVAADVDGLFDEQRSVLDPYARAWMVLAYELSGDRGNNQRALLADLNDGVVVSATGAHWEDASLDFRNLNSDVRGTAVVIDALSRTDPDNLLLPQAVRWLMVARTAQRWSTGHETAWSIQALTNWMEASGELVAEYEYLLNVNTVQIAAGRFTQENITEGVSESIPIGRLAQEEVNFIDIQRGEGDGRLYYTVHLNSFVDAASVSAVSRGVTVQRTYYDAACDPEAETCQPIDRIEAGQQVRVELTIVAPNDLVYAIVEDPIPSGAEAIDPGLETSAIGFAADSRRTDFDYRFGYWGWWYFNRIEFRDEKVVFLAEFLPAGTYQYTYFLQANIPGEFQVMPTTAREEFFPERFGRSDGMRFTIYE